jgi:hypothetical protein
MRQALLDLLARGQDSIELALASMCDRSWAQGSDSYCKSICVAPVHQEPDFSVMSRNVHVALR